MTISPFVSLPRCAVGWSVVCDCEMESAISTFVDGDQFFKVNCNKKTKTVQIRLCAHTL